jgi:hypothetical protein
VSNVCNVIEKVPINQSVVGVAFFRVTCVCVCVLRRRDKKGGREKAISAKSTMQKQGPLSTAASRVI